MLDPLHNHRQTDAAFDRKVNFVTIKMTHSGLISACLVLMRCFAVIRGQTDGFTYTVIEGSPSGLVGNPVSDGRLEASLGNLRDYRFSFVSPNNSQSRFFTIDRVSGEIRTIVPLDREVVCVTGSCPVNLDVAVQTTSAELVKILRVRIDVTDINDNTPTFSNETVGVSVSESAPVDTTVGFYSAVDLDTAGNNSVITYHLQSSDGLGKFAMKVVNNWDGSSEIGIVLHEKLDREVQSFYQLRLIAKDGGSPSLTGTLTVDITVTDSNDHTPVFTKSVYNVTILENVTVGKEILRVEAQDADIGINGQISYKFTSRSEEKINSAFRIERGTGAVIVNGAVDFETSSIYQLIVEASDAATPSKSSQAAVVIKVLDVNDNPPKISFNLLAGGDHGVVSEFAKPGSFVAHVSVTDADPEVSQHISCKMESEEFSLQQMSQTEYKIILLTKLNREAIPEYKLSVFCVDNGVPSLSSTNTLLVLVRDENDHAPVFEKTTFEKSVSEDFPVGKEIIRVTASDRDVGSNGKLTYELVNGKGFLSVEGTSGVVVASKQLDRELNETLTFQIVALDGGEPQYSATATVTLHIDDINDIAPDFTQNEYVTRIFENQRLVKGLEVVSATDPDTGLGGEFLFTLEKSSAAPGVFRISSTDGTITTSSVFDREERDEYRLVVMATDKGTPPLSSSAVVVIKIEDVNDNDPVIFFPTNSNNTVEIKSWENNAYVTQISASDRDDGDNGRLTYGFENSKMSEFLYISAADGIVRLSQDLNEDDAGEYDVSVLVKDNGNPVRFARQTLYVRISPNNGTALSTISGSTPPNMAIVIAVVAITLIVSLAILLVICVIRKHDRAKKDHPSQSEERKIMRRRGSSSTASKTSQQSDLSTVTCMDELRKDVSLTISDDSQGFLTTHQQFAPCYILPSAQDPSTQRSPKIQCEGKYDLLERGVSGHERDFMQLHQQKNSCNEVRQDSDNSSGELTSSDSGRGASEEDVRQNTQQPGDKQHCENYVKFIKTALTNTVHQDLPGFGQVPKTGRNTEENHYYDMTVLRKSINKRGSALGPYNHQAGKAGHDVTTARPVSLHIESSDNKNRTIRDDVRINPEPSSSLPAYFVQSYGNNPSLSTFGKGWRPTTDSRCYSIEMENLNTSTNI